MSAVFVISEFNPFHRGHKYLIDTLHKDFDTVVCVMSGNSVQRGEVACAEKYLRAKTAVNNGVNLVVELPFPFCSLSAAEFAYSGVFLSRALGCKSLAFGAEAGGEEITRAADILYDKAMIRNYIKLHPKLSYPKAAQEILKAELGEKAELIEKPNNILAAEYLSAIKSQKCGIEPVFVRREKKFASSSEIRKVLFTDAEAGLALLPEETSRVLQSAAIWDGERLDAAILSAVRLTQGKGEYYGVDSGTFRKIYSASLVSSTVKELCEKSVSPNLTFARIRRTLLCVLTGVGKEYRSSAGIRNDNNTRRPSYALVLAADAKGREYLAREKKNFSIPLITKPADYAKGGERVRSDFEFSLKADRVLSIASGKSGEYDPLKMTPFIK